MLINLRQIGLIFFAVFILTAEIGSDISMLRAETDISDSENPIDSQNFVINRSLEEVTIIAKKMNPETEIYIQPPFGKRYSYLIESDTVNWHKSDNFDMITINNPTAGLWKVLFSLGRNNKAYFLQGLQVMTNADNPTFPMGKPINIESWIKHDEGIITEPDILGKIKFIYEVTKPDGKILKLLPFEKRKGDGSEDATGLFTHLFDPNNRGTHHVKITAQAGTFKKIKTFSFNVTVPEKHAINENKTETKNVESFKQTNTQIINQKKPSEKFDEGEQPGKIHWAGEIIKFLLINFILFVAGFGYFKRKEVIHLTNLVLKKGSNVKS